MENPTDDPEDPGLEPASLTAQTNAPTVRPGVWKLVYLVVCLTALLVAGLTLFSGFGLGTLLMPAFAVFFPVEVAVAATAIVHLANNIFKLLLVGKWIDYQVAARFAIPAAFMAVLGANLLNYMADREPVARYTLAGKQCEVTEIKLIIAAVIAAFTLLDFLPSFKRVSFGRRLVPLGGALSGFFGGLSGNQGALRTAFLVRIGLPKEALIGTMVASAIVVDLARLTVYGTTFLTRALETLQGGGGAKLVAAATACAFAGSFAGARLVRKVTLHTVHTVVGIMLLLVAASMAAGII
jgi:hypothetical protein